MRRSLLLVLAACAGPTTPGADTDTPVGDTDAVGDTDRLDTDVADTDPGTCVTPEPGSPAVPDPRSVVQGDAAVDALAADLTAFAAAMHRAAAATGAVDTWLSPVSLAALLVTLDLDGGGAARAALDDVLAPSGDLVARRAALAAWLADLSAPPAERAAVVQHALALFHRADRAPGPAWTAAAAPFGVSRTVVDVGDPEAARARINGWVAEHTACLIPELFAQGQITSDTAVVAVDALAVVADWKTPFEPDLTTSRPFRLADGATVDVPTMAGVVHGAGLGTVGSTTVLRLPVTDPTLALYVALPAAHDGLDDLEAGLDGAALRALLDAPQAASVEVTLPKLDERFRPDTEALLGAVGLGAAVAPDADRGDLCDGCVLDTLVHEATLVVDEQGLRAAAASGGVFTDSGTPALPRVEVDRPFLVVLHDEAARVPLFVGRIGDPRGD